MPDMRRDTPRQMVYLETKGAGISTVRLIFITVGQDVELLLHADSPSLNPIS